MMPRRRSRRRPHLNIMELNTDLGVSQIGEDEAALQRMVAELAHEAETVAELWTQTEAADLAMLTTFLAEEEARTQAMLEALVEEEDAWLPSWLREQEAELDALLAEFSNAPKKDLRP